MKNETTHFLSITDLTPGELESLLGKAGELKKSARQSSQLQGKALAYASEKPSTRTKLSFQAAIQQLGGSYLDMTGAHMSNGKEEAKDTARVVSGYADFFAARVFRHAVLEEFAQYSSIPVINALSDAEHPCQALADLQTILETKGKNATIAFVGDANNVCNSLALGTCMLGLTIRVASPQGYELEKSVKEKCQEYQGKLEIFENAQEAVQGADAVYTDTWVSMGDESQKTERIEKFKHYQVNSQLMGLAKQDAVFMHCLPATKGQEVTTEVIEGRQSIVFEQAENRLHAQKALLLHLDGSELQ